MSLTWERKQTPSPESAESLTQDQLRRTTPRHAEIKMPKREYKRSNEKATSYICRGTPRAYRLTFKQKLCRPEGSSTTYLR